MVVKWTSERNEKLLMLVIGGIKVDKDKLAQDWKEQYPDEDFHPTARAIVEQFYNLQKKSGVKGGAVNKSISTPKSTTKVTPRTPKFKTPTGGTKRSRAAMSDDDDDDDDDEEIKADFHTPLPKRATPSRRSVSRITYADPGSSEDEPSTGANGADDSDDGLEAAFKSVKTSAKTNAAMPPNVNAAANHSPSLRGDSVAGGETKANGAKGKEVATRNYLDEDSDGSNFNLGI